jgi:hypothetical protein
LGGYRRLNKDDKELTESGQALTYAAMIYLMDLMVRRLDRIKTQR